MSTNTAIEWTDSTFNGWWGCTKVSPACDHCYAEALDKRTASEGIVHWGPGVKRRRTSERNWNDARRWDAGYRAFQAEHGRRRRVFCLSMGDWLDNEVPIEWFIDLMELIRTCTNMDWLMLTKRISNFKKRMAEAIEVLDLQDATAQPELLLYLKEWLSGEVVPPHIWVGITVVNQEEVDRDVPKLLATPARVRFLSIEPMLGAIMLKNDTADFLEGWEATGEGIEETPRVDWVIAGGESGGGSRPSMPDWYRSLRDQCEANFTPFLFKQWGDYGPPQTDVQLEAFKQHGAGFYGSLTLGGTFDPEPNGVLRIGKKAAGRMLDGRTHDGYPDLE